MRAALFAIFILQMSGQPTKAWHFVKDNPKTNHHIAQIDAKAFEPTANAQTFRLHGMTARLYNAAGVTYKQITSKEAVIDEKLGTLTYGPRLNSVVKLTAN